MRLSDYIDQEIIVLILFIEPDHYQTVRLVGVEAGGIWIESQAMVDKMFSALGEVASERTPIFFFPYHQIEFAMVPREGIALNESTFGVASDD
jgi:hypothetical protein